LLIYDCKDELAAFNNAPRQVMQREHALLKMADVVFTGGLSLYVAKRSRNDNVHCFPSSVVMFPPPRSLDYYHPDHALAAGRNAEEAARAILDYIDLFARRSSAR
jgi:UDP-galactopyranose mutase